MNRFDTIFSNRAAQSWIGIDSAELIGFLKPKCKEVLTFDGLELALSSRENLRIKFGIDPTASDIHLGNLVPIMLLRQFAKAGHHIDFIIGDFTARVGDPTARETGRSPLTPEKINDNMQTYTDQIGRFLDLSAVKIHHNSFWLNPMTLQEIFSIFQGMNLAETLQREDFRARIRNSQGVSLAEVCYGVLMGIDSVHLESDIEVGGIDQLLNFQQCRKVMRDKGMREEVTLMTPILEGTSGDGKKMSKSFGNYIALGSSVEDKFGKIMSIADRLILTYFCCFADVHESELSHLGKFIGESPLEAKKQLATTLIALETGDIEAGLKEREKFERRFSSKAFSNEDCIELFSSTDTLLIESLMSSDQFKSKSELRRLFDQGAVRMIQGASETRATTDTPIEQALGKIIRVGKRKAFIISPQQLD